MIENQRTRLIEYENDTHEAEMRELMEVRGDSSEAPKRTSRSGSKRRVRAAKKPRAVERQPNDEESAVPLARFHIGGLMLSAKEYYAARRGLARVHCEQLVTLLDAGCVPPVQVANPSIDTVDFEVYGLTEKQVRTLRNRPRITADYLNAQAAKSVAKNEAA